MWSTWESLASISPHGGWAGGCFDVQGIRERLPYPVSRNGLTPQAMADRCRDGTCVRDYLHVIDLASGHLLALDALEPNSTVFDNCPDEARYKAYNLGKGRGMSVLQIVEAMRKATGFDFKYEIIGRRCVGILVL